MSIDEYFGEWMRVIDRTELAQCNKFIARVYKQYPVCPNIHYIYKAFRLCPYNDLRCVFLGQDPYPQKGIATGLLFANSNDTPPDRISPSLDIVKDSLLRDDVSMKNIIFDQSLESWAKQGILMLNSALTVRQNLVGSHRLFWRMFITKLLRNLSINKTGIVYVLFGREAQSFKSCINDKFNHIIECKHPAYYARREEPMPNVFKQVNDLLYGMNGSKISFYHYAY